MDGNLSEDNSRSNASDRGNPVVDRSKLSLIKRKTQARSVPNERQQENHEEQKMPPNDEKQQAIQSMKQSCSSESSSNTRLRSNSSSMSSNSKVSMIPRKTSAETSSIASSLPQPPVSTSTRESQSQSQQPSQPPQQRQQPPPQQSTTKVKTKLAIQWTCDECNHACIPVRSESRCLCGHRYKEHKFQEGSKKCACSSKNCPCEHFFFIVAEGAWILKCRCKHKHIEHHCGSSPFLCKKVGCQCTGFDSPWVCNCGHSWKSHTQSTIQQTLTDMSQFMTATDGSGDVVQMSSHEINEIASTVMNKNAMNDMNVNMMYRRDGVE